MEDGLHNEGSPGLVTPLSDRAVGEGEESFDF